MDLPPLPGTLKEPFEIKVYEIDDVERLQRHRHEDPVEVSTLFQQIRQKRQAMITAFIRNACFKLCVDSSSAAEADYNSIAININLNCTHFVVTWRVENMNAITALG